MTILAIAQLRYLKLH